MINVRYIVSDVDAAIEFYTGVLGFTLKMRPAPGFAALENDGLTLYLNAPGAGGGGTSGGSEGPVPGGWNRFQLVVDHLKELAARLADEGVTTRGEMVEGRGGRQLLIEDPSGNPIELFEPFQRPA